MLEVLKTWAWTLVPGLVLLAILASTSFDPFASSKPVDHNSPEQYRPGNLNAKAVTTVRTFDEFPVLWLGEEFAGYRLTGVTYTNVESRGPPSGRHHTLALVYGECVLKSTCYPALAIVVWAPGSTPLPTDGALPRGGGDIRGLSRTSFGSGQTPVLYAGNGLAIEIQSSIGLEDQALWSLSLANAAAIGLPDIGPNDDLAPLHEWRLR